MSMHLDWFGFSLHRYDPSGRLMFRRRVVYARDSEGRDTASVATADDGGFRYAEFSQYDRGIVFGNDCRSTIRWHTRACSMYSAMHLFRLGQQGELTSRGGYLGSSFITRGGLWPVGWRTATTVWEGGSERRPKRSAKIGNGGGSQPMSMMTGATGSKR